MTSESSSSKNVFYKRNSVSTPFFAQFRNFFIDLERESKDLRAKIQTRPYYDYQKSSIQSIYEDFENKVNEIIEETNSSTSRTIDTIKFEDFYHHCKNLYEECQTGISVLEEQLSQYGYVKEEELEEKTEEELSIPDKNKSNLTSVDFPTKSQDSASHSSSQLTFASRNIYENFDDLNLSQTTLDMINSKRNQPLYLGFKTENNQIKSNQIESTQVNEEIDRFDLQSDNHFSSNDENESIFKSENFGCLKNINEIDLSPLPIFLKNQMTIDTINENIAKMNLFLYKKLKSNSIENKKQSSIYLHQSDFNFLNLGFKEKAFIMILVKVNQLQVEVSKGETIYRVKHIK